MSVAERGRRPPFLALHGVAAGYGQTTVIANVDLSVGRGEVVALLGLNGAGKSTLVKAIIGIVRVTDGEILVGGDDITGLTTDEIARRGVGYVPQVDAVFHSLTVRENLQLGGYLLPKRQLEPRMMAVVEVFPALSMVMTRVTARLSGGEQRMVAIARVLMTEPQVVILDEPTASLAPLVAARILEEHLLQLRDANVATLIVEQRVRAALDAADWAYVLANGGVRRQGPAADVLEDETLVDILLGGAMSGLRSET